MKKYIINFLEDSNKTIVTRYLKENFLMKSKFFILLYSIYLIYVRIYISEPLTTNTLRVLESQGS